jgi:hypothetical protein
VAGTALRPPQRGAGPRRRRLAARGKASATLRVRRHGRRGLAGQIVRRGRGSQSPCCPIITGADLGSLSASGPSRGASIRQQVWCGGTGTRTITTSFAPTLEDNVVLYRSKASSAPVCCRRAWGARSSTATHARAASVGAGRAGFDKDRRAPANGLAEDGRAEQPLNCSSRGSRRPRLTRRKT